MSDTLIKVEGVSKKFCRSLKRSLWYGMQDLGRELLGKRHGGDGELRKDEFWAIKDVSFEVKRGECLGLIGRNGAGKTTLLRIINGLVKPDLGRVTIRGKVSAIIALGAGFNPILTGKENIYINATVLGIPKTKIDTLYERIVDFSELREFINTPIQSYSSGMQVRLGFSIAAHCNPDILLLDEVLAVGDAKFRAKCYRRISELRNQSAIIFVSHNSEQIGRIATSALWMEGGIRKFYGNTEAAISAYEDSTPTESEDAFISTEHPLLNASISTSVNCDLGELTIHARLESAALIAQPTLRIWIYNRSGLFSAEGIARPFEHNAEITPGENIWDITFNAPELKNGTYWISVFILTEDKKMLLWAHRVSQFSTSNSISIGVTDYQIRLKHWNFRKSA